VAEIFVGSVSVGVVPDARDFHNKLREQVVPGSDRIGDEIGRAIGRQMQEAVRIYAEKVKEDLRHGFNVDVHADTTSAKEEVEKAKLETEAKSWRVRLHVDNDSLRSMAAGIGARLKAGLGNLALGGLVGGGLASLGSGLLAGVGPLGAAGLGLGAFAAVAVPELTKVHDAMAKVGTARKTALGNLTPQERQLIPAIKDIKDSFHGVVKELAPVVDDIVKLGAGVLKDLMPTLGIFAHVGASILINFLKPFDQWIKSKSFQQLADQFAQFGDEAGRLLGPQIVNLLKALAQLFVQLLPSGIRVLRLLIPFIIQFIQALAPGLVILAQIAAAVLEWINKNHLLIPVLMLVLAAVVIIIGPTGLGGIIAAIALVALTIGFFAKHWRQIWQDIKNWAKDAWDFLTHGWGQWLVPGLTLIRKAVEFVRDHWKQAWTDIKNWALDAWHFLHDKVYAPIVNFLTKTIPTAFDIFKETVRITWDGIKIDFLTGIKFILDQMGKLPGPLGAPFRRASHDIAGELQKIRGDVRDAVGNIQNDWAKIHGKSVAITWHLDLPAGVHPGPAFQHRRKYASGTMGAEPGWAWVGEAGPELIRMKGGEVVIPNHALGGRFPGYAAGTSGWDFYDRFDPTLAQYGKDVAWIGKTVTAAVVSAGNALVKQALRQELMSGALPHGPSSASAARAQAYALSLFPMFGWGMSQMPPLIALWNQESGWNAYAVNPTSGAYGIPQSLGHGHPYNLGDYMAQVMWGERYIKGTYGSPAAAWAHEVSHNWYDDGGWWPNNTIGINTSGHAEYVLSQEDMKHGLGGPTYHLHFDGMSYKAFGAEVGHAMRVVDVHRGLSQRSGRRV